MNESKTTNDSLEQLNITLEQKLNDQLIEKRTAESAELIELRRTMVECEMELHDLRDQYLILKAKAEDDLDKEHQKIGTFHFTCRLNGFSMLNLMTFFFPKDELTQIVQNEMDRNKNISKDLQALRNATGADVNKDKNIEQVR